MSDIALEMIEVSKKFKRGEIFDSLRDLIPALTGQLIKRLTSDQLERQEFWALKDISFTVKKGEAFGIIGHNGAGKSTILKLLSGILRPTKGKIIVSGKISALIEVGAGFHPDLTGRENIFLNGAILGMKKEEIRKKLDEIVEFAQLNDFIDTPVKRYSSGMYARLGFAVAAYVDPDVLVVDEVLSVGDFVFQKKSIERMRRIMQGGTTVIFVSHNIKAVTELCQNALLLDHGKGVKIGETREVTRCYLETATGDRAGQDKKDVYIARVSVKNACGSCLDFDSGEKAWIEVDIKANRDAKNIAISIDLKDEGLYTLFDISTERLGHKPISLAAGESWRFCFQVSLYLASGIFYIGVKLYPFDERVLRGMIPYDVIFTAATIQIHSNLEIRGVINPCPILVENEKVYE
jgi:lipopolysaccharide transport system ATP-binding protein